MAEKVASVKIDGVALTVRATIALVEANAGSYYHDATNSILYVSAATGTVFGKSVIAVADIKLATKSKVFSDEYYDPRLTSVPSVSIRIEKSFGGVGQISAGALELANLDGAFDQRADYLWNNADTKIQLKLGYDTRTEAAAYGDYVDFGVWQVDKWSSSDKKFSISLAERKSLLEKSLLTDRYDKTTYPSMDDDAVGDSIPRAYGQIYGAPAVLINESTKTFKVAGHTIQTLDEVRLFNSDVWTTSSFTTKDLTNGEFTCSSWVDGDEISVDFKGRLNADSTLMDNASDVVEDILLTAGIAAADIDSTALTAAWNALDAGLMSSGIRSTIRAVSAYLDTDEEIVDILSRINASVGSFLIVAPDGTFRFKVFEPEVGEDLAEYNETDCLAFTPSTEIKDVASKVYARYANRISDEWWSLKTEEETANQFDHNVVAERVIDVELDMISDPDDAEYWAQRYLQSEGKSMKLYKIILPAKALTLLPGNQLHIKNNRRSFDGVLEVLHLTINFGAGTVSCLCGNLREWGSVSGFWVSDSAVLPTRFSAETGYGSGSNTWNSSWSSTIKNWAKQNVGYWTDANGFADSTDPDSHIISTWF
jgi:hypothetical protein